ncbi:MAG: hypothetical protein PEGG_01232 [Paraeggerthella hongkongensis]|uniref:hypothetical protein n=1 Tax=Paraeggerthella hominis TaxID=2897351 RepID=UPI001C111562|nr:MULTISPECIES: hypothetical protein [Paraeggerthella]MBU5405345.1 hypothetical protein [Paraeggerthella hongkongensis]MCD2432534.1 hypothetical protein [Paraeggerthella hominis]
MAISEVYGLDRFAEYMKDMEDCYTVIGGTACDIILRGADLPFRITKDIDLILIIENRFPEGASAVWKMVKDGGYTCGWKSSDTVHFYRFTSPKAVGFPSMIELFSKAPSFIEAPEELTIVPLPADEEISSLSAILLDENYYAYMKSGRKTINGVTVLDEVHLVPFKAKAYIDLSARKARGEHVNSGDLKKHKKDVFRLAQLFGPNTSSELVPSIRADMVAFCNLAETEGVPLQQIGVPFTLDEAIELLKRVYKL